MCENCIRELMGPLEDAIQMSLDIEAALAILNAYHPTVSRAAEAAMIGISTDALTGTNEASEEFQQLLVAFVRKQADRIRKVAAEQGVDIPVNFLEPSQNKGPEARPLGDPSKAPLN